jgi:hypothetical protein
VHHFGDGLLAARPKPKWRITPCRLSPTAWPRLRSTCHHALKATAPLISVSRRAEGKMRWIHPWADEAPRREGVWESQGQKAILSYSSSLIGKMFNFAPRQLNTRGRSPGTNRTEGWVDSKVNIFTPQGKIPGYQRDRRLGGLQSQHFHAPAA